MGYPTKDILDIHLRDHPELDPNFLAITAKKVLKWICIFSFVLAVTVFVVAYLVVPLLFMTSTDVQRLVVFTNFFLECDPKVFETKAGRGIRNLYLKIRSGGKILELGAYHYLPRSVVFAGRNDVAYNFDALLAKDNVDVLIYFHGSGEDRTDTLWKCEILSNVFHVISFDYRDFGDSTRAPLTEGALVEDCIQVYDAVRNSTAGDIFFWGHSMGAAIALSTMVALEKRNLSRPKGIILEAPFTSLQDEIYHHPYGRIFSWLPWFECTILKPLNISGFNFRNDEKILQIQSPLLIINAVDDSIIPYEYGRKLFSSAIRNRNRTKSVTMYNSFDDRVGYDHFYLYESPLFFPVLSEFLSEVTKFDLRNSVYS